MNGPNTEPISVPQKHEPLTQPSRKHTTISVLSRFWRSITCSETEFYTGNYFFFYETRETTITIKLTAFRWPCLQFLHTEQNSKVTPTSNAT